MIIHDNDIEYVNKLMYEEWDKRVTTIKPQHTDEHGFFDMVNRIQNSNSDLYFVTARKPNTVNMTDEHFKHLKIDDHIERVHYVGDMPKGLYISETFDINAYDQIIFIDDILHNLHNVQQYLKPKIKCYRFCLSLPKEEPLIAL